MNSYLVENADTIIIQGERNKLINDNNFGDAIVSIYDIENTFLDNALEDLDTYSFLSLKKVVIIQNIDILKYDDNKDSFEHLFKYIDNPNNDNLLIIEVKKLNNATKVAKELKKRCRYISGELSLDDIINNNLEGYQVSKQVKDFLIDYCDSDVTKILNECIKLRNYKMDSKSITIDDIKEIVTKKLKDPKELTFGFARSIAVKDIKDSLEKYKMLLDYSIEPLSIIGLLASQIRIIYQVKLLEDKGYNTFKIAEKLGEKSEYRVKKTKELTPLYTESELLELMKKLSDIDYKIKTTDTNPNGEIEMFIINLKD